MKTKLVKVSKEKDEYVMEINISLQNTSKDTIYYISHTCEGWRYDIVHGKMIDLCSNINCNQTLPFKQVITPGKAFVDSSNFCCKDTVAMKKGFWLKLGYHVRTVDSKTIIDGNHPNVSLLESKVVWSDSLYVKYK